MNILFLTSVHDSLSQRLRIELTERGHQVSIALATSDEAMLTAVAKHAPDLIIALMLKVALPEAIWSQHECLIVHPGYAKIERMTGQRREARPRGRPRLDDHVTGQAIAERGELAL